MAAVRSLLAARTPGDQRSLQALAVALAATVRDTPPLPADPVALYDEVETRGSEEVGTWQEVRAARDFGDITPAEYDYLAAAVAALTLEEHDDGR
jgi:hypothetical protein